MKKSGFTLIEVLISLVLVTLILLAASEFFLTSDKNIREQMRQKGVDDRAFLAMQILGSDISRAGHILDSGSVGNSSLANIKAWLNLSPWVSGADLQVWHLNPNSDWLVVNAPKPIGSNFKKLALDEKDTSLQIRLDGNMQGLTNGNSLDCLFANFSGDKWLGADFADFVRVADPNYYSFTNPVNSSNYDSMQTEDFEKYLFDNFALHFGVWKNKNASRVFPSNWHETRHLILDKSQSILPKNQGCIEIENPPPRLVQINGTKSSSPQGEILVNSNISKNTTGAYTFTKYGNTQIIKKDFLAKNTSEKTAYFAKDKNQTLVVKKSWRRINATGALLAKNTNLDVANTKIRSKILGSVEVSKSGKKSVHNIVSVEKFQPLLQAYNSTNPSKFFLFYANSNTAKKYKQQISSTCPASGWQKPQIANYKKCSAVTYGIDFYNAHCKNKNINKKTKDLPSASPFFEAKIAKLDFDCTNGFKQVLNSSSNKVFVKKESEINFFKLKTNTSYDSKTGTKSIFYYRSESPNLPFSTLLKRADALRDEQNYFATSSKVDKNSNLSTCDIKKFQKLDFNSTAKKHYLPKFEADILLKPQNFIKTTNSKSSYKEFFNCRGTRAQHTSYTSNTPSATRTNSEWRFSLRANTRSLKSNYKFEPHLWYVQKPTKIDRDNSRTLIYSVAKCNSKRQCAFHNKNIRNQINGLNSMQIRFLNPISGVWQNPVQMKAWLTSKKQSWDKIKLVKIGILVCDFENFLPEGEVKKYRVLDAEIEDNSSYCKVLNSSFYLRNPALNMR